MHCIDTRANPMRRFWKRNAATASVVVALVGCTSPMTSQAPSPVSTVAGSTTPSAPMPTAQVPSSQVSRPASPVHGSVVSRAPEVGRSGAAAPVRLPPARTAKSWTEFRTIAAHRLVAANPAGTYMGDVPDPLLAIPVLEVELNADGSVRKIDVLRRPTQATDTIQMAIDAIHRAAPFGDVSRLPMPWKFNEVFLFDEQRRFKPRTLDQ